MLIVLATLATLASAGGGAPSRADTAPADCHLPSPSQAPHPSALVGDLLDWIGQATGYDVSALRASPPRIVFCRTGDDIAYEGRTIHVEPRLRAAYDLDGRRIYLVEPWRADDAWHVSTLLHELVHAVQFDARRWPCPQAAEWEAYRLQADWLALQGVEAGFDWVEILMLSRCPRDVHP